VSFITDFMLGSIQYVVKFKRNSMRSQRTARSSKDKFLLGAYRDFTCVDCEAYTFNKNSLFSVLI